MNIIAVTPLGHPAETPKPKSTKALRDRSLRQVLTKKIVMLLCNFHVDMRKKRESGSWWDFYSSKYQNTVASIVRA
jgi:hypothetical protein